MGTTFDVHTHMPPSHGTQPETANHGEPQLDRCLAVKYLLSVFHDSAACFLWSAGVLLLSPSCNLVLVLGCVPVCTGVWCSPCGPRREDSFLPDKNITIPIS